MKTCTTAIVASEVAVSAICAALLYTKVAILALLVESMIRIVGLF